MAQSAAPATNSYDPRLTFAPLTLPEPVNSYRSSNGAPGPSYWQNEADYEMHASLDTAAKVLTNDEVITYTNNSPDTLPSLWVMLEQNTYRKDSRARLMNGGDRGRGRRPGPEPNAPSGPPPVTTTDGYVLDSVTVETLKQSVKADYLISDTRMQVRLATPLKPHGSTVAFPPKAAWVRRGVSSESRMAFPAESRMNATEVRNLPFPPGRGSLPPWSLPLG